MRSLVVISAAAATALVFSACGGGGGSSTSPGGTSGAITISITRENGAQSFSPNPAAAGARLVVFKNNDTIVHRVILNDGTLTPGTSRPVPRVAN